ncbi:Type 1 glutamine amidotransferase-like domain-containing protein [Bacillus infantis]|uniref:Type 1 glutamine amidotransferase-like domain-containing protein n=1 Tax=Bacillus infantis TaxID=324767 RepID=UPI003CF3ADDA
MRLIIAMGGGGFSMEPENLLLDQYIIGQSQNKKPKICFLPTASGDQQSYIDRFYEAFGDMDCIPAHLSLFEPNFNDAEEFLLGQDIIYVGGGNTRNMMILWKEWGLDELLIQCYQEGIILAGISAGSICWFEEGLTDPLNGPLYRIKGLGILKGSHCPHYDGENKRKSAYRQHIRETLMKPGYAADDGTALHFVDEILYKSVSSRKNSSAYYVEAKGNEVLETKLDSVYLAESGISKAENGHTG